MAKSHGSKPARGAPAERARGATGPEESRERFLKIQQESYAAMQEQQDEVLAHRDAHDQRTREMLKTSRAAQKAAAKE